MKQVKKGMTVLVKRSGVEDLRGEVLGQTAESRRLTRKEGRHVVPLMITHPAHMRQSAMFPSAELVIIGEPISPSLRRAFRKFGL